MLNDLWTQVLVWSTSLVTPDWGALIARIPLVLLLVVAAFLVITGAKWTAVGPPRVGISRGRLPLTADGRELRSPAVGPLVLASGVFMVTFGLLAGTGWLVAGAITVVVALVGWAAEAWDSPRRRLPQVPRARLTARLVVIAGVAATALVLLATTRVAPEVPGAAPSGAAPLPSMPGSATAAAPSVLPSADTALTARGVVYLESSLSAPADRPFTVAFDNRDSVPHNLEIRDASGATVFRGDLVTGPTVRMYDVPTLPAGAYQFICTVHPAMTGTLTVK